MYLENLPEEFRPENPDAVKTLEPRDREKAFKFLELYETGVTIMQAREQLGVSGSVFVRWMIHPEFKAGLDRVRQLRATHLDDVTYQLGATATVKTHEDRKLYLQAHHPDYKKNDTPTVAVQINIDPAALEKSRARYRNVTDTTTSTPTS